MFKKSLSEKTKRKRGIGDQNQETNEVISEKEISELTLKRLHTLGNQKFGSYPYSNYFNRWLENVKDVLLEFESHPNISADDQYLKERIQILSSIELQLEDKRRRESLVDHENNKLSEYKMHLKEIDDEYLISANIIRQQKNFEVKHLQKVLDELKIEQNKVIRMKTGFLRGISKKNREQKEIELIQKIIDKQKEMELILLDFGAKQKKLREDYEIKKEPLFEKIKQYQKLIRDTESDSSSEDRWFTCESLVDLVNTFLQRKTTQTN